VSAGIGVDLGKTGCRAVTAEGRSAEGPGAPGLADPGGVEAALAAVRPVVDRVILPGQTPDVIVVGAAGAQSGSGAALAEALAEAYPGTGVGVTTDAVTAHAGGLGGAPGAVVAIGTGSVAVGLAADGRLALAGGWGPWLGDDGSGWWIGREALRAVLAAYERRGPSTSLTDAARARYGERETLTSAIHGDGGVARTVAAFAPDVLAAAEAGDPVAVGVLDAAVGEWVSLAGAVSARAEEPAVALVGGLGGARWLRDRFARRLPADLRLVPSAGAPVDGALLLATRTDLPHEALVVRRVATGSVRPSTGVDRLATEQVRADLADLDVRPAEDVVAELLASQARVPDAMAAARGALVAAVRAATTALDRGGRLIYVGAGTPGRLAAQDAAECPPTFGTPPDRVVAVLAGGSDATSAAVEGAEDDAAAGARDLLALGPGPDDLVVGIAASGRTPFVVAALRAAREAGAPTAAIVSNPGSVLAAEADIAIELLTGPEVLSGSTRLAAGTAQKIALNVISTGAMIGHGKTYGAWMVDVMATNDKLRRRAARILREAAGVDDAAAVAALAASGWRVKPALVGLLAGVDVTLARDALAAHGGRVRAAVAALGSGSPGSSGSSGSSGPGGLP